MKMSPCNTIRSFAISLAILILITESPTNGFTIRRTKGNTTDTSETDLSTEESVLLEVKTLRRPNDLNAIYSKTPGEHRKIQLNKLNGNEHVTISLPDENENQTKSQEKSVTNNAQILSSSTEHRDEAANFVSTERSSTIKDETANNSKVTERTVSVTLSSFESENKSNENIPSKLIITETTTEIHRNENISQTVNSFITPNLSDVTNGDVYETATTHNKSIDTSTETTTKTQVLTTSPYVSTNSTISYENSTIHDNQTKFSTSSDIIANESSTHANKDIYNQRDDHFKFNVEKSMAPEASESVTVKTDGEISKKFNNSVNDTYNFTIYIPTTAEIKTTQTESNATPSEDNNTVSITTKAYPATELRNLVKGISELSRTFAGPSWKKYTTIDRKRASTKIDELTTAQEDGMLTAETMQTRTFLDKVSTYSPIPLLEKLEENPSIANLSTESQETNVTEQSVDNMLENNSTTSPLMPTELVITRKIDTVLTKRAGFLDNSGKTTPLDVTTTANLEIISPNDTKTYDTLYEIEALEGDGQLIKNASGVESLSQLAEDAIKEELLKEMTLNDHEENKEIRYRDENLDLVGVKALLVSEKSNNDTQATQENVTGDALSVQPITSKNTSLYTVSPNYKPMKKIDVQPPKPFVRDPDDNSWRNESISSLGIVFKPKNSSKSFTQVLKNKTETEFSNLLDRESKSGVPDLRERLEKIAEVRKSKKKRIDKFGEVVYTDYEETNASGEGTSTSKTETTSAETISSISTTSPKPSSWKPEVTVKSTTLTENVEVKEENITTTPKMAGLFKNEESGTLTTQKPNKFYNIAEYYDTTDEYDADYLHLSKLDLKRFTTPPSTTETTATPVETQTKPVRKYSSDRKPTIQYFPPRKPTKAKVNINDYDDQFQRKVNLYTFKDPPNNTILPSPQPAATENPDERNRQIVTPATMYKTDDLNKNLYSTHAPRVSETHSGFAADNGNYNRASYVIKHYRDFIDQAAKDDDDRNPEYPPYTEPPMQGVTINVLPKATLDKEKSTLDSYDYDQQFRKDILNRFVDNFNQNSERFKVDFPILYNSSVVHRKFEENGKVLASSSAFMKRLYDATVTKPDNIFLNKKYCDPNCENITVDLSPAYELHYYIPEQEEKEEVVPSEGPTPYQYRL